MFSQSPERRDGWPRSTRPPLRGALRASSRPPVVPLIADRQPGSVRTGFCILPLFQQLIKKAALWATFFISGGEGGIRTLDTLLTYTRIPIVRFRPLWHFSGRRDYKDSAAICTICAPVYQLRQLTRESCAPGDQSRQAATPAACTRLYLATAAHHYLDKAPTILRCFWQPGPNPSIISARTRHCFQEFCRYE